MAYNVIFAIWLEFCFMKLALGQIMSDEEWRTYFQCLQMKGKQKSRNNNPAWTEYKLQQKGQKTFTFSPDKLFWFNLFLHYIFLFELWILLGLPKVAPLTCTIRHHLMSTGGSPNDTFWKKSVIQGTIWWRDHPMIIINVNNLEIRSKDSIRTQ